MIKIGLVGGTKVWHARTFSEMFNGYDKEEAVKRNWGPLYAARVGKGSRITHVWDVNKEDAKELAKICNIENVVSKKEDMIGKIDGVIIADDATMKHQKRATPFLRTSLPTFIDKPLSPEIKEAEKIIELAKKYNAPLMSCSALRYAKEVEEFKKEENKIGDILTGYTTCRSELTFKGIHALEQLYSVVGPGIKSVRNVGKKGKDIVVIRYKDERKFILSSYRDIMCPFQMTLYGTKGYRQIVVNDQDYFYSHMMKAFVEMVETKKEPFPLEETLEIIKVLALGKKSRRGNKEIKL